MDASNDNEHIYTPLPSHLSPLPPPPSPSHEEQQVRSMDTEVDNFKKNITKEQERNEQLTLTLNKVTSCTYSYGSVWHLPLLCINCLKYSTCDSLECFLLGHGN